MFQLLEQTTKGLDDTKKLTLAIAAALLITFSLTFFENVKEVEHMTDKLIRLHIVANSDSEEDQQLKLTIRESVLAEVDRITKDCSSKQEAELIIMENLPLIEQTARSTAADNGFYGGVTAMYESTFINRRIYDGFELPSGMYDALCIRVGKAEGRNWWCVVYPSLCVSCAASLDELEEFSDSELVIMKEPSEVKYKLYCFELFQKLKAWISSASRLIE